MPNDIELQIARMLVATRKRKLHVEEKEVEKKIKLNDEKLFAYKRCGDYIMKHYHNSFKPALESAFKYQIDTKFGGIPIIWSKCKTIAVCIVRHFGKRNPYPNQPLDYFLTERSDIKQYLVKRLNPPSICIMNVQLGLSDESNEETTDETITTIRDVFNFPETTRNELGDVFVCMVRMEFHDASNISFFSL